MTRRTKIVATIGPASQDPVTLEAMVRAGMDVARISIAHTPLEDALRIHESIRGAADTVGRVVATLVDLPGPIVRIGRITAGRVDLVADDKVTLTPGDGATTSSNVYIGYPRLLEDIDVGELVNLGESIVVRVESAEADHLTATVVSGGWITGRAAVRVRSNVLSVPAVTDDDRAALDAFLEAGVDIVALSVRHGDDLDELNLEPIPRGPMLIAKIESMAAVHNLTTVIGRAAGIIIGRGGLGLEAQLEDLPHLQKHVIRECIASGLPVITASQMLESMMTAPVPTRAETTDVTNAVFDGTSAVMLSAETAVGAHPVAAVETMARIAERADDQFDHHDWTSRVADLRMAVGNQSDAAVTDAMTIGAVRSAEDLQLKTLLCISASGFTVRSMARFRPEAQILGFSHHASTVRQLASSWGVTPVLFESPTPDYAAKVGLAIERAKRRGLVASGELVGVVAGITSANRATDTFRIVRVP
ncbi:MAG TPA: pyruvate kinase [Ilumatobacter sp.]|nr:pyruvate kinase [Ilumatobacter sp.]